QNTVSGGSAPSGNQGGTDPIQTPAGSAVSVDGVQVNMSQGGLQQTGINTNLAVEGDGFFVVQTPSGFAYTRAGNFTTDANGTLVNPQGNPVQGWTAAQYQSGKMSANTLQNLTIPLNTPMAPQETGVGTGPAITLQGNLNVARFQQYSASSSSHTATFKDGTWQGNGTVVMSTVVYNSVGQPWTLEEAFTPSGTDGNVDVWNVQAELVGGKNNSEAVPLKFTTADGSTSSSVTAAFYAVSSSGHAAGTLASASSTLNSATINYSSTANNFSAGIDWAQDPSQLTQYAQSSQVTGTANGNAAGTLQNFSIGDNGIVTGVYSNGLKQTLGVVALANFTNPMGLQNIGNNLWLNGPNSGNPQVGQPNSGQFGSVIGGSVEGSNVNLSQQFVNMTIAQQEYEANSKVLTVGQTVDQALINAVQ
ncbi:MAG: flagellar hook-basal body complex protein, partial [Firmicutes bacterium]|nr:flagellar hook-basal body complex protein [Bacillota bacterium]